MQISSALREAAARLLSPDAETCSRNAEVEHHDCAGICLTLPVPPLLRGRRLPAPVVGSGCGVSDAPFVPK